MNGITQTSFLFYFIDTDVSLAPMRFLYFLLNMHHNSGHSAACVSWWGSSFTCVYLSFLHQFFTLISSSPVSTPWAWCHVAWGRIPRCTLSLAPPWSIQRRLNPNRDGSLSSTTLMVRNLSCIINFLCFLFLHIFFNIFSFCTILLLLCSFLIRFIRFLLTTINSIFYSLVNVHSLTFSYHLMCFSSFC